MFGFGVGFGVGEFGSAGFALEVDDSAVAILGGASFIAEANVTKGNVLEIAAESSMSINPAGVILTSKTLREPSPVLKTAKPATTPAMRAVPAPITTTTYTIPTRRRRDRQ